MSKRAPSIVLLGLLATLCGPGSAAANAEFFPLHCRGRLGHRIDMHSDGGSGSTRADFYIYANSRNKTKAGERGERLAEGTCAWEVRALKNSEPATLYTISGMEQSTLLVYEAIVSCLGKKDCVFEVEAYVDGDYLWFNPYEVNVRYPKFTE